MIKYCEETRWDSTISTRCKYIGFTNTNPNQNICLKYQENIEEDAEGWRRCCKECEQPFFIEGGKLS
jgi:hypothetical protein